MKSFENNLQFVANVEVETGALVAANFPPPRDSWDRRQADLRHASPCLSAGWSVTMKGRSNTLHARGEQCF
jgi:hypothetical protein